MIAALPLKTETLVDLLALRARQQGANMAFGHIANDGSVSETVSFHGLDRTARGIAGAIAGRAPRGSRVIVIASAPIPFIEGFFGLLYAGFVPVPAPPPGNNVGRLRIAAYTADCEAVAVLGTLVDFQIFAAGQDANPSPVWWIHDELAGGSSSELIQPLPHETAFLQYTSGSTSAPRGVVVTHRMVISNEWTIAQSFGHDETTIFCSWLPLFHDMGLIGGVLQPLYLGIPGYLFTPMQFLARPQRWLEAIGRYRVTTSGAPNFAYDLCVDHISPENRVNLDLSSWRIAFNGAEPLRGRTLARFGSTFRPHGFNELAFYPCYGLAEATLFVAGSRPLRGPLALPRDKHGETPSRLLADGSFNGDVHVGSGMPAPGLNVLIVDPSTKRALAEGDEGEIWIAGDSVAQRYWTSSDGSDDFAATVANDPGSTFLRTGDLGFLRGGELFVTGRLKDLIIVHGRNYHPADLEDAAATVPLPWRHRSIVAFAGDEHEDGGIVVLVERPKGKSAEFEAVARAIRAAIRQRCGVHVRTVGFVGGQRLPTTTSGKLRRAECGRMFAEGRFDDIFIDLLESQMFDAPPASTSITDATALLSLALKEIRGHALAESEMIRSFAELGFDSFDSVSLAAIISRMRGPAIRPADVLSARRVLDLADLFLISAPSGLQTPAPLPNGPRPAAEAFIAMAERYPDRSADNVAIAFELPAGMEAKACQEALAVLVQRHATLRTAFYRTEDGVVSGVMDEARLVVEQFPVDGDVVQRSVDSFAARPFDPAVAPLIRAARHITRNGPEVFQIVLHHAVIDLCSLTLLMDQFWILLFGEPFQDLRALPASDAGVEDLHAEDNQFWRRLFLTAALLTPIPGPMGIVEQPAGRAMPFEMPHAVTQALRSTAMQLGSTMTVLLLTAYQCVLALYTGQTRVITALPFYSSPTGGEMPSIGCNVQTLPVVTEVNPDDTFVDLVGRVRRMLLDLISRQFNPRILEGVEIQRDGNRNALMQFGFSPRSFNWMGGGDHAALGLKGHYSPLRIGRHMVRPIPNERFDPAADLLLTTAERGGCLIGAIEYDAMHVSQAFAQSVLGSLKALLQTLAEDPARATRPGLWVDPAADGWCGQKILTGPLVLPQERSALALFFKRHRAWRHSCAVEMGDQRWSYDELFRRVRRAARSFAKLGIEAGDRVAVEAHGSPELVGAMLALWHRGAVHCPIDPGYPAERRKAIYARLAPKLVLTGFGALYEPSDDTLDEDDLGLATTGGAPAYIMFTSGSTGQPKGVVIPHRGICNTAAAQRIFDIQPGSRVLQASSIGFDASIFEIALALGHGATLVFPEQRPLDEDRLRDLIGRSRIDHLVAPPSLVAAMGSNAPAPQTLIVAGEACPRSLVRDWASRCRLFNAYGPTEASIWVTVERLSGPNAEPLVGRPIDNASVAIVDARLRPLPRGAPGELVVGGPGVALGYLGETEREKQSFVRSKMAAGDIYRTGDRMRMRDDGSLEFLGRLDRQVKVNGVRVELDEVEAVLAGAPGIARFGVTEFQSEHDRTQLAGIVVPLPGSSFDLSAVRAYMRRRLPDVMIPSVWRVVDTIPVDAHGKADYGKLRTSVAVESNATAPRTPLDTPMQLRIAQVCQEILGRYPAYREDNLLELGLHSLNAARVLRRLSTALGRRIPISLVFERPILEEFAGALEALGANAPVEQAAADISTRYFLTPIQKDIWLHSKLLGDTTYVVSMVVRLRGGLDSSALAQALALVIQRHPMLHSRIGEVEGEPCAIIGSSRGFVLRTVDASHSQDPLEQSRRSIETLVNEPFDFEREIPVRALLVTIGPDEFVFGLITHHLFVDGWSVGVMVRDMSLFYAELAKGGVPAIEKESGITRCVDRINSAIDLDQRLGTWRDILAGFDAGSSYIPDTSSPSVRGVRASRLILPPKSLASLGRCARKCGVSNFSVVAAAFSLVIGRQQGREDVVISVVSANRDHVESESAVGCLASVLPVRCSIASNKELTEFIRKIDRDIRAGLDLSGPSLSSIGIGLEQAGQSIRSSLLAAMIVQIDPSFYEFALADLQLSILPWRFGEPKAGLLLEVREAGEELELYLEADPAIFDEARTARVVAALDASLETIMAEQAARVGDISGLAPDEYVLVTRSFNETRRDYGIEKPLHRLVEDAVDRYPDAIALRSDGTEVTYAEFDRMTNGLAHLLRRNGVEVAEPVGVCCVPGLSQVSALHGIMKSGAAYVPLDPDLPASRHAHMITDLGLRTVVCDRLEERWAALGVRQVVHPLRAEPQTARITSGPEADDPAYILFTSGSTGEPKAVANTHAGIVNRLLWMQDAFLLRPGERVLQKTTFTFDVSVWEYFWPLIAGGTLCTIRPGGHLDPTYLYNAMRSEQVSILHFTPTALAEFLRSRDRFDLPHLRCVITSGEALSVELRDAVFRTLKAELHNLYGPTEAAIDVSHWHCRIDDSNRHSVPIGRPISNIQLYVVDDAGRPAPIGVPGELLIGGVGVASGYVNKPELTHEKFVPDVFNPGGRRLYRTGDVARWTDEGILEYFGRNDDQVKLHGVRIEPAEINAAMKATLGVAESVVIARGDGVNQRLVAFVVPGEEPLPPMREARRLLAAQLPAAFIPAAIVPIAHIPLMPSGKLDRRALPTELPELDVQTDSAPKSLREAAILSAWRQVLGRQDIGIRDNFFDVGGNSALLMRLQNELKKTIAMNVPVIKLLKYTTVQSLAAALDGSPDVANSARDATNTGVERLQRLKTVAARRKRILPQEG